MTLSGRRVFITGAATGIGGATAEYFVEHGVRVFGAGLDGSEGRAWSASYAPEILEFREADLTREAGSAMQVDGGPLTRLL